MITIDDGSIVSAEIIEVASYGVTISYSGLKGFVQILEVSWDIFELDNRLKDICIVGDIVKVKVLSHNEEQFYASIRAAVPELDPWREENQPTVGQQLRVEVVRVTDYGYLVKLPNFVISVLATDSPGRDLEVGQFAMARVEAVDTKAKKVLLESL